MKDQLTFKTWIKSLVQNLSVFWLCWEVINSFIFFINIVILATILIHIEIYRGSRYSLPRFFCKDGVKSENKLKMFLKYLFTAFHDQRFESKNKRLQRFILFSSNLIKQIIYFPPIKRFCIKFVIKF